VGRLEAADGNTLAAFLFLETFRSMPIKPNKRHLYPKDWKRISYYIRFIRANNHCENCGAENYKPNPATGSRVILTCAHLDHDTFNNHESNLKALCQLCHNRHDAQFRALNRKQTWIDKHNNSITR
jgi:hypothetical protein